MTLPERELRPMALTDIGTVMALEAQAYSYPWTRGNFIDSLAAGYPAQVLQVQTQIQIQIQTQTQTQTQAQPADVLGYFVAMHGVGEMHLLNVTVAPAWQGRGLGQQLLDAVQDLACAQAMASLWLEVRESNHRARALYRRRGFDEVGLRRFYYPSAGRREDAVVMRLQLAADNRQHAAD